MPILTLSDLRTQANAFAKEISQKDIPELYGITDGKAVGTYIEVLFNAYLQDRFEYEKGNAATGIDFPTLNVDLKVTSVKQPQSSCPFRSAEQKIYGLGYNLLVLVYEKQDDKVSETARLNFQHAVFVASDRTGDFQMTRAILDLLSRDANQDDLIGLFEDRNLPLDEIGRVRLAEEILRLPPKQGYLTISNALQWRLQYTRAITVAEQGETQGVDDLFSE